MAEQAERIGVGASLYSHVDARVKIGPAKVGVIVCHPWGPLGGSMHDHVVMTAWKIFADAGCTTARFNFRSGLGCGGGSVDDIVAVAKYLLSLPHQNAVSKILLVGYSYGSICCMGAAAELPECIGFAAIGPPIDYGG